MSAFRVVPVALVLSSLTLGGCIVTPRRAVVAEPEVVVESDPGAPPAEQVEVVTASPGPEYVWVKGHWAWRAGRYVWLPGHWAVPPRARAVWVPGHWDHRGRHHWVWIEGHWA